MAPNARRVAKTPRRRRPRAAKSQPTFRHTSSSTRPDPAWSTISAGLTGTVSNDTCDSTRLRTRPVGSPGRESRTFTWACAAAGVTPARRRAIVRLVVTEIPVPTKETPLPSRSRGASISGGTTRTGTQKLVWRSGNQNVSGIVPMSR